MATSHPQWPKSSFKRGEVSSRDHPHPYQAPLPLPSTKGTSLDKQPSPVQHEKMELMGSVPSISY